MNHLSGMDASFLHLETPETPMHVGGMHTLELPNGYRGNFYDDFRQHIVDRLHVSAVFTRKLAASSGATSFSKTFGTSAYDDARGVATLNGSEVFITGATQGPLAPPYEGRPNSNDGYVRKLSSTGNPVWTR